ncbi:MAG: hypothetical protein OXU77_19205 [Gammaproteobacteria bacterium]|nr:hypothetical protein [Gammaproteobacteria bacterium]MDE0441010.1 hypothetical protein [Gammaproteobacteria bacterium]
MAEPDRLIDTYLALREQIAHLVTRIVPPKQVEDVVRETYVRICRVDPKETIREPRSYVVRTARNLALDHVKRSERCRRRSGVGRHPTLALGTGSRRCRRSGSPYDQWRAAAESRC